MHTIISSASKLSPDRLTRILNEKFGNSQAKVASIGHEPVGFGLLGDSIRFSIEYDQDCPAGYPTSVVGKFSASDPAINASGAHLGVYATEVGFYREIADTVAIRRPYCLYAEVDDSGRECGIIMEDLGPARAGDQIGGCSLEDAHLVIEQAAALHGPLWNDPTAIKPWMNNQQELLRGIISNFGGFVDVFLKRFAARLSEEEIQTVERFGHAVGDFYNHKAKNQTIVHFDLRLDNILFDARGGNVPVAILDWQSVVPGKSALDIGFFLSTSLPMELRRSRERELLSYYLDCLHRQGVRDYSADQLWEDYRCSGYQALFTSVTASYSARQTERADQVFTRLTQGGVALINDLESFQAVVTT